MFFYKETYPEFDNHGTKTKKTNTNKISQYKETIFWLRKMDNFINMKEKKRPSTRETKSHTPKKVLLRHGCTSHNLHLAKNVSLPKWTYL
jgi:hypothetical protein